MNQYVIIDQTTLIIIDKHMRHIYCLILAIALLLASGDCRRKKEKLAEQTQTKEEKNTVVEANHFYSDKEKTTTYDIGSVEKDKSLIFILKDKQGQKDDKILIDNPINITLDAGNGATSTCQFKSYNNLCSISKVAVDKMKLKIQCQKTPCQLSWQILQPAVHQADGDHALEQLVSVNAQSNHAVLRVSCSNPTLFQSFSNQVQLYSNSNFKKMGGEQGLVYFLFDNEQKGYYYLKSDDQKVNACANATLLHANETITFNDEKQTHYDFIGPKSSNTYEIKNIPTTDFRVEFSAHDLLLQKLTNTTGIAIVLNGYIGNEKKEINKMALFVDDEKDYIEFNAVYKKPTQKYDKMEFQFHGIGRFLIIQARFMASDTQQVELGQESYFSLQKGDKIKYHINPVALPTDSPIKKTYIFVDESKKFKANQTQCELKGCFFELEALQTGEGSIYIGEGEKQNKSQIVVLPFEASVTSDLKEGDFKYFSTKLKAKDSYQFVINTPNVIAYASSKAKCETVDEKCYQKIFTYHNPTIYQSAADDDIVIKVVALDNTQFTITRMDKNTQFIELQDTVPFAYLFDNQQKKMIFYFKSTMKQDISFNLIAPTNQLDLLVVNKQKPDWKDEQSATWANDGFIKFESKDIKQSTFFVEVRKKEPYANKWIHFTLIASSKEQAMQLEPGMAHYQTIKPKDTKDLIFQFDPQKKVILNFYTHNIKQAVKINMKVSDSQDYTSGNSTAQFTIDKQVDVFDFSLVSKRLCEEQDQNCEIFIQLENMMSVEADVTITMMMEDAIIELKDGVWQNYNINHLSVTSHFYFIPTHQDHSATIFYKSSFVDLKIMYSLWQTDDKSMSPALWPFPTEFKQNQKLSQISFKPLQFIHIEMESLKKCWPNCVVLLSIAPHIQIPVNNNTHSPSLSDGDFKIMASNNFIELPERHKIDIALVKGENKAVLVDLKYHLDKESVTFYTYNTLGFANLSANVYTEKNPRCPTPGEDSDFKFTGLQTDITVQDIKSKLSQNSMQGENTPFLCILASAYADSKVSIEFTSDKNAIKTLAIDTTTAISLQKGDKKLFQIQITQEVYLKIARDEGFPFFQKKICKADDDISKCVEQFQNSQEKGIQLADKVTGLDNPSCSKCTLLFKLTAQDPAKVDIHVQSKYTEIELAENKPISDELLPEQENRYTLTGTKSQEMIINIQILSGNIRVEVHDFAQVNITKSNTGGSKNIHIVVPPKNLKNPQGQLGTSYMTTFALSSFVHLHLVVVSQNPKEQATYTITYSSGDPVSYLQDGLITEYNIVAKKTAKFIYQNPGSSKIYVHATTTDVSSLNKLQIKAFAMDDPQDEDGMLTMTPQKPSFNKKTPNPTMLLQLPAKKSYFLQVVNNNDKDVLFTLGVNNRQIIYLPFDHQFPLHIVKGQFIYVVLSNSLAGYIKISFNKCDQSEPFIGYTMDYNDFVNEDFQVEEQMTEELTQDLILKVKTPGAVYIKIRSPEDDSTLMSVKASFSANKIQPSKSKAGDKGLIQYQILDSTKAQLTFTTLVCGSTDKNCNKDFTYSALSASNIADVYAQLVCSSIVFDLADTQQLKSAQMTAIPADKIKNNKVSFTQPIKGEVEYVGVKAINSKTGETVYYQPVELVTFMGQLHRTPIKTLILGAILIVVFACGALIICRRLRKNKEYSNIGELNDQIE